MVSWSLVKNKQVGANAGVGIEHAIGQAHNGVQVTLGEQRFLDAGLNAFTEERAVGQHQPGAAARLEDLHEQHEKEVGGLAGAELGGKVGLDAVLLHAAEGRVGDDDIHALLGRPVAQRAGQRVVVAHIGGDVDAVQQQIGHAEDVRQVLLLDAREAFLDKALRRPRSLPACAGARWRRRGSRRCRRRDREWSPPQARIDLLDDELGHGARGVELTRVAGGLEVLEDLLVDVAEHVAVIGGIEVDAVDLVDDLPHEGAVLHVVVGILEGHADRDPRSCPRHPCSDLSLGSRVLLTKSSSASPVIPSSFARPGRPAQMLRQRRLVVVAQEFEFLLAVVEDLQKEHPAELFEPLRIAVGAGVLAHDVLDGFDDVGDIGHG